jgi:TadE-like protein
MPQAKTGIEDRSRRRQSGTAAIEFGLFIPVLLILLTGTAEFGLLMYEAMQVNNAVEAGALYAAAKGWNLTTDPTGAAIATAVVNASILPTGLNTLAATPAPAQFCGCPTATGITNMGAPPPPCSATACTGSPAGTYVQVNALLTHTVLIPAPTSWGIPATLSAKAVIRIN